MKNDASPGGFVDPLDNFINLEEVVKQNNKIVNKITKWLTILLIFC